MSSIHLEVHLRNLRIASPLNPPGNTQIDYMSIIKQQLLERLLNQWKFTKYAIKLIQKQVKPRLNAIQWP